jgi:hypothetical protein
VKQTLHCDSSPHSVPSVRQQDRPLEPSSTNARSAPPLSSPVPPSQSESEASEVLTNDSDASVRAGFSGMRRCDLMIGADFKIFRRRGQRLDHIHLLSMRRRRKVSRHLPRHPRTLAQGEGSACPDLLELAGNVGDGRHLDGVFGCQNEFRQSMCNRSGPPGDGRHNLDRKGM